MHRLFFEAKLECQNLDIAHGPQGDLADSFNFDRLETDTKAGEYVVATASPECGTFPKSNACTLGVVGQSICYLQLG